MFLSPSKKNAIVNLGLCRYHHGPPQTWLRINGPSERIEKKFAEEGKRVYYKFGIVIIILHYYTIFTKIIFKKKNGLNLCYWSSWSQKHPFFYSLIPYLLLFLSKVPLIPYLHGCYSLFFKVMCILYWYNLRLFQVTNSGS